MIPVEAVEAAAKGWFAEEGELTAKDLAQFRQVDFQGKVIIVTNRGKDVAE